MPTLDVKALFVTWREEISNHHYESLISIQSLIMEMAVLPFPSLNKLHNFNFVSGIAK